MQYICHFAHLRNRFIAAIFAHLRSRSHQVIMMFLFFSNAVMSVLQLQHAGSHTVAQSGTVSSIVICAIILQICIGVKNCPFSHPVINVWKNSHSISLSSFSPSSMRVTISAIIFGKRSGSHFLLYFSITCKYLFSLSSHL